MTCPVNVYTEWGPLKEVLLGDCLHASFNLADPTFELVYYENLKSQKYRKTEEYRVDKTRYHQRIEDLKNLHKLLEELGVKVRRPDPLQRAVPFKTPWFKGICQAPDNPRDTMFCIADMIIETPPTVRGRYFETHHWHKILNEYFRGGAKWITAPRPSLTDESIDYEGEKNWKETVDYNKIYEIEPRFEIAFDAANIIKFGKDILFNIGCKNHELGAFWLERILYDYGIRLHRIRACDSHIDAVLAPIAPGAMLYNPVGDKKKNILEQLPAPLKKWDVIPMQEEDLSFCIHDNELILASQEGMFINILSINEKQMVIQDTATNNIKNLEKHGFEPIPITFNQGVIFSGGIHCCTVDIYRDEKCEDYFGG
jgi:glycine amidinotransferase